jgi:hypothetical protein
VAWSQDPEYPHVAAHRDRQDVAFAQAVARLGRARAVDADLAVRHQLRRQGSRLQDSREPKPFVEALEIRFVAAGLVVVEVSHRSPQS